jgi:ABC-type sugar transport system permease subunit
VFFLPVIIATGPVYAIISGDMSSSGSSDASQFSTMFETDLVGELLEFIGIYGISDTVTETIQSITTDIFSLVWNSGIQILIFLAALQNIPVSAKEAAQMEGATAWEYFWKITFPYVSPMILANLIFTIIDSFTDTSNSVMNRILEVQSDWKYGEAAAMAWSYFAIVMVAVGIIVLIVNKFIYYEVD